VPSAFGKPLVWKRADVPAAGDTEHWTNPDAFPTFRTCRWKHASDPDPGRQAESVRASAWNSDRCCGERTMSVARTRKDPIATTRAAAAT